ncbi:hypothetical protein CVT25_005489 [Psilocybe cyanescens]|uniref:Cytochrome P450 n=1 Tax=Psilocybe cyanescens TaxID=93625 RepID=A0A409VUB7_PSICY|nr:hypothetical protein CVT25_005489 [Psilocybe cyanescens]
MSTFITSVASLLVAYIVGKLMVARRERRNFPPGPKGLPLIGNALDFPTVNLGPEYVQWGQRYNSLSKYLVLTAKLNPTGDILHASAFGTHVIIINNRQIADELFERRAVKYSDRPYSPTIDLAGMSSYNLGVMRYGEKWRIGRKFALQVFRQASTSPNNFSAAIITGVHQALKGLLHSPERLWDHNKIVCVFDNRLPALFVGFRLSISIPMSSMYGYDAKSVSDPCITAADASFTINMELASPGGSFINILPALRFIPPWFPGAFSRRKAETARKLTDEMVSIPLEFTKARVAQGDARPSVVADLLERKNTVGVSEEEEAALLSVAPTAYAAGSDTTQSSTGTFLYLMVSNPDVQRKAQAEIDSILGSKRLPGYEDRPSMPYVEAIYREVLRWRPPGSIGFPHSTTEDDVYDGYFIPKAKLQWIERADSIFYRAMTHDETKYPDPMAFKPERFINPDGSLNDDDRIMAFGFGRRVCVGKHVASATVRPISILAVFNLEKARDQSGTVIEVNGEYYEFGLISLLSITLHDSRKKPFKCSILPRSEAARQLVEQVSA